MANAATLVPVTTEYVIGTGKNTGELLVKTMQDTRNGLVVTIEYPWFSSVPEATTDLTAGDITLPAIGDPSEDMVTALAATLIRALRAPLANEELRDMGGILVERPNWVTGNKGLTAWSKVMHQLERKGWGIGCTNTHYELYRL